ncbi:MAG: hypothetical protein ACLTLY_00620 [Agathobacter rectalis]
MQESWVICIKNISRWRIAITVGFGIKSFLGNTTENITKVVVPKETTIYEGVAAPQNIYDSLGNTIGVLPGGGNQVYIPKVEAGWFK